MVALIRKLLSVGLTMISAPAAAEPDFGDLVGYTIVASKTVAGYIDSDGKREDSFEGCDYDRVIVFDDDTYVRCKSYGYEYAYRPNAVILVDGTSAKMLVGDETYDVSLR